MAQSVTAQSYSSHDLAIDMVAQPSLAAMNPQQTLVVAQQQPPRVIGTTVPPAGLADWFHTLPSGSISSFKELAYVFTKEYTSYRTIKKNPDHLFNVQKKSDESLRDYIKRFKAERANIVGCDDQIASSAFKRELPIECKLYRELTISPHQTLIEVFATAERYALWDDDQIAAKKADQAAKQASKENGKRRSQPQEGAPTTEKYTKFTIPIHQILAQVNDMPWLKKPSPLKGNLTKKDTSRYFTFHEGYGHYTNDCFA
ncbi:uncharacterized protein LOC117636996 [Prunus dulcis]|uniref:uncharacterized protein LOC117636996 n=1 Tax=Prunus dulcis TaxID=3755 RepID=UPI0014828B04|nr:uncharacterized protein LOC117636996 [Prunus dulcis]